MWVMATLAKAKIVDESTNKRESVTAARVRISHLNQEITDIIVAP
jgi:hypothetical protein